MMMTTMMMMMMGEGGARGMHPSFAFSRLGFRS